MECGGGAGAASVAGASVAAWPAWRGNGGTGDGCGGVSREAGGFSSCAFGAVSVQVTLGVLVFHLGSKNNSPDGASPAQASARGTELSRSVEKRLGAGKRSFASELPPADFFHWSESSRGAGGAGVPGERRGSPVRLILSASPVRRRIFAGYRELGAPPREAPAGPGSRGERTAGAAGSARPGPVQPRRAARRNRRQRPGAGERTKRLPRARCPDGAGRLGAARSGGGVTGAPGPPSPSRHTRTHKRARADAETRAAAGARREDAAAAPLGAGAGRAAGCLRLCLRGRAAGAELPAQRGAGRRGRLPPALGPPRQRPRLPPGGAHPRLRGLRALGRRRHGLGRHRGGGRGEGPALPAGKARLLPLSPANRRRLPGNSAPSTALRVPGPLCPLTFPLLFLYRDPLLSLPLFLLQPPRPSSPHLFASSLQLFGCSYCSALFSPPEELFLLGPRPANLPSKLLMDFVKGVLFPSSFSRKCNSLLLSLSLDPVFQDPRRGGEGWQRLSQRGAAPSPHPANE